MSVTTMKTCRVSVSNLERFCLGALRAAGTSENHAWATTEALVKADSWGVFTHGTKLLAGYLRRLRAGGIRTDVEPEIVSDGPAWAVVDGRSALGQVTGAFAMRSAVAKAKAVGVSYVGVRNSNHFGAAGYYAWLAAREGLIGVAMCNDVPSVAAPGSRTAVTGTNPIAYALPAGDRDPILLDIAISTVAGGKVYVAHQRGQPIPPDWLIGSDGKPTTDAKLYPEHAALAPMSGHKGYGLALLIESLSGLLSGAAMTHQIGNWMRGDASEPTRHGAAFLAFHVDAIAPSGEFAERVRALSDEIRATPTADGVQRVLLPGEREWANHQRAMLEGIELPPDVVVSLEGAALSASVPTPWENEL